MRIWRVLAVLALAGLGLLGPGLAKARAAQSVDVALVLAADVSRSITADEFQLQRRGYAHAIASPEVVKAIEAGVHGAIAITFIEWSGETEQQIVVDWQVIHDVASAKKFVATLLAAPRAFYGRTSISAALEFAMEQLQKSGVQADRRIIDVSGDGTNNAGPPLADARAAALAAGITINGLAIINERGGFYGGFAGHTQPPGGLPHWYQENVVGGPGSFLLVAKDFASFADAMTKKLVSEISSLPSDGALALRGRSQSSP